MKKTLTLFIFLLVCLKLSVVAQPADTNKMSPPDPAKDTIKSPALVYNLKFLALSDFSISTRNKNNFGVAAINHYSGELDAVIPV
ncbi:MAG: hypothetical protein ABIN13_17470, partial [Mucilaginibacter sp.]